MSNMQSFRSAFNGFNRQDVVNYIAYMNNQHNSQLQQLTTQLQNALSQNSDSELQARLVAAEEKIKELEAALAQAGGAPMNCTEQELEAYRRAERAERIANERSAQICEQANAILADASCQVDNAAAAIDAAAENLNAQLQAYKSAVDAAKTTLHDTVSAINAITPESK